MSIPSVVANLVNRSLNGSLPTNGAAEPDASTSAHPEAESIMPIHKVATSTTDAIENVGLAALHPHDEPFIKKKVLGKGGFGVVNLCERKDKVRAPRPPLPSMFRTIMLHQAQVLWPDVYLSKA